ncbi:MAG TPA: NAD(P)/FAD-dependent oxidoreductase, partial [Candidatus Polarisedimenticolaceae bacterium]|nr:NAD(P)/FAD-dependent oxidoreductase [Candidatus Polarisedimenticolaceae bacterium]
RALADLVLEYGGRIVTGSTVAALDTFDTARAVLLDLTPRQVLRVAGARLPRGYARRLARYRYGPGVFKLDWALAGPIGWTAPECRSAGTIHLGGGSAAILRASRAAFAGRDDAEPFVILTQPSLFDATRAPAGSHVAWAYAHVPHGSLEDRTAAIERQVERFAPGFRDLVLARHAMDTRALETRNPNLVGGDIGGGIQDLAQLLARPVLRIDPYRTPVRGLYLCSASTPPGGAVHGMCGYHAARSVLRDLRRGRA